MSYTGRADSRDTHLRRVRHVGDNQPFLTIHLQTAGRVSICYLRDGRQRVTDLSAHDMQQRTPNAPAAVLGQNAEPLQLPGVATDGGAVEPAAAVQLLVLWNILTRSP